MKNRYNKTYVKYLLKESNHRELTNKEKKYLKEVGLGGLVTSAWPLWAGVAGLTAKHWVPNVADALITHGPAMASGAKTLGKGMWWLTKNGVKGSLAAAKVGYDYGKLGVDSIKDTIKDSNKVVRVKSKDGKRVKLIRKGERRGPFGGVRSSFERDYRDFKRGGGLHGKKVKECINLLCQLNGKSFNENVKVFSKMYSSFLNKHKQYIQESIVNDIVPIDLFKECLLQKLEESYTILDEKQEKFLYDMLTNNKYVEENRLFIKNYYNNGMRFMLNEGIDPINFRAVILLNEISKFKKAGVYGRRVKRFFTGKKGRSYINYSKLNPSNAKDSNKYTFAGKEYSKPTAQDLQKARAWRKIKSAATQGEKDSLLQKFMRDYKINNEKELDKKMDDLDSKISTTKDVGKFKWKSLFPVNRKKLEKNAHIRQLRKDKGKMEELRRRYMMGDTTLTDDELAALPKVFGRGSRLGNYLSRRSNLRADDILAQQTTDLSRMAQLNQARSTVTPSNGSSGISSWVNPNAYGGDLVRQFGTPDQQQRYLPAGSNNNRPRNGHNAAATGATASTTGTATPTAGTNTSNQQSATLDVSSLNPTETPKPEAVDNDVSALVKLYKSQLLSRQKKSNSNKFIMLKPEDLAKGIFNLAKSRPEYEHLKDRILTGSFGKKGTANDLYDMFKQLNIKITPLYSYKSTYYSDPSKIPGGVDSSTDARGKTIYTSKANGEKINVSSGSFIYMTKIKKALTNLESVSSASQSSSPPVQPSAPQSPTPPAPKSSDSSGSPQASSSNTSSDSKSTNSSAPKTPIPLVPNPDSSQDLSNIPPSKNNKGKNYGKDDRDDSYSEKGKGSKKRNKKGNRKGNKESYNYFIYKYSPEVQLAESRGISPRNFYQLYLIERVKEMYSIKNEKV